MCGRILGWNIAGHLAGRGCGNFIFYAKALRWHFKGFLLTTLTLNNPHRLFAGEQFYPFIFSLSPEGHPHVSIQVLSNTGELIGTATTNIENGVCLSGATYGAHFFDFGCDYYRYCGY